MWTPRNPVVEILCAALHGDVSLWFALDHRMQFDALCYNACAVVSFDFARRAFMIRPPRRSVSSASVSLLLNDPVDSSDTR